MLKVHEFSMRIFKFCVFILMTILKINTANSELFEHSSNFTAFFVFVFIISCK